MLIQITPTLVVNKSMINVLEVGHCLDSKTDQKLFQVVARLRNGEVHRTGCFETEETACSVLRNMVS